jgi:SIR2-like domain
MLLPNASSVTVLETLHKLDGEFRSMATAMENGEFALWVGSGISRNAPNLGDIVARAIEYLRQRATDPNTQVKFKPAFQKALNLSEIDARDAEQYFDVAFVDWPEPLRNSIIKSLWKKYSKLLDLRIKDERDDFLLWDAVNIRSAFDLPAPPACEHLCIAILILEGAVSEIASANWDGFIEAAVIRLGRGLDGNLQVVVDPGHLRDAPAKARLLKFHGCIVHATEDPTAYREFLTASESQIIDWPENPKIAAMRAEVVSLATNFKALMIGLSLQDVNLQTVFSRARNANPWPWPCEPNAQGHVFCEEVIGDGQRTMLKVVYGDRYNQHMDDIERCAHFRAWPEQVLLALVLKMLTDKLSELVRLRLMATALADNVDLLTTDLRGLRDTIAAKVNADRTAFTIQAIAAWSRTISLFRAGLMPTNPDAYEVISAIPIGQLAQDMNVQAAGFGELGVALAVLEHGRESICDGSQA